MIIKRNKNIVSSVFLNKEESRSLVKRAGLKIIKKGKSRPLGVRGFESHLLH